MNMLQSQHANLKLHIIKRVEYFNNNLKHLIIAIAVAGFIFISPTLQALSTFKASYSITFGFIDLGDAKMVLNKTAEKKFKLGFFAQTTGFTNFIYPYSLQETSQLERLTSGELRTIGYFYQEKKETDIKKSYLVDIDYANMRAWRVNHPKPREWNLTTKIPTDKLSFAFILGDDIERGKEPRSPVTILDGRQARIIVLKELIHDQKKPQNNFNEKQENQFKKNKNYYQDYRRFMLSHDDESMEIWLTKSNRHIPKKMLFTSDGWTLRYELKKITWQDN